MLSPMIPGRKIPGIIKKINKALFGKFIYLKYLKFNQKKIKGMILNTIRVEDKSVLFCAEIS